MNKNGKPAKNTVPPTYRIMIPLEERKWTVQAVSTACALARAAAAEIVLVDMIPVQNPYWIGTELVYLHWQECPYLSELERMVTACGIPYQIQYFEYLSLVEAIAQAADIFEAQIIFARTTKSLVPFWQEFQRWRLRHRLARHRRQLYDSLDDVTIFELPGFSNRGNERMRIDASRKIAEVHSG
jgi:hypothetical protein